jgi:hypothetical protein
MKLNWKIFKKSNFYYFKLNQYSHIFAIDSNSSKDYICNLKGMVCVFDYTTNQRKLLKTVVPYLQYNLAIRTLAKRIVNN